MGVKHKKLKEWIAAGLITQVQADAIQSHEDTKKSGHFGRGLINLSIFAILVGILSIIASNWHEIPSSVKIGVHVLLNLGMGFFAFYADQKNRDVWRDGATLAFFGLTMTLIILIGQIYQLTGTVGGALLLWVVATLPFMALLGRTYGTVIPWMMAVLATIGYLFFENVESLPESLRFYIGFGLATLLPLVLALLGQWNLLQKLKPALADVCLKTGILWLAFSASASLIVWQGIPDIPSRDFAPHQALIILLVGLAGFAGHAAYHKFYKSADGRQYGVAFALVSFLLTVLPFLLIIPGSDVLSAIAFIAYWVFVGWIAQMLGHMRIVSLAIVIIAIRIFVVYIELFKDLITTGVGLISAGVVMLGLIYTARKLNMYLTKGGKNAKI